MSDRPCFAFTLGDIAGIGPEVAVRAAIDPAVREVCRPMLFGPTPSVQMAAALIDRDLRIHRLVDGATTPQALGENDVYVRDIPMEGTIRTAEHSESAGRAAYVSLRLAIDETLGNNVEAVVTAPLNKKSLRLAGIRQPGHTEILAEQTGARDHAMMLYLPAGDGAVGPNGLAVCHVTLHEPIASVPGNLTTEKICGKIRLIDDFLRQMGQAEPRIAVAALNPHAGEDGLFGLEEAETIEPAIDRCAAEGVAVTGPLPVDTLFRRTIVGHEFDGVVAMYHDQGHIPMKLIAFDRAVNVTLGLPIIRTSPSHGTAYDIAWTGRANAAGMVAAALTAAKLRTARLASQPRP